MDSQDTGTLRLAAIADIHCTRDSEGALRPLFTEIARQADALVVCGDLTAYGLPEEAAVLVKELGPVARALSTISRADRRVRVRRRAAGRREHGTSRR